jgi:hypothetical protein
MDWYRPVMRLLTYIYGGGISTNITGSFVSCDMCFDALVPNIPIIPTGFEL